MKAKTIYQNEWNKFKTYYKNHFIATLSTFILSAIVSYFFYGVISGATSLHTQTESSLNSMFGGIISDNPYKTAFLLFLNNSKASLTAVILGFIPLFILPYLSALGNGLVIGVLLKLVATQGHSPFSMIIFGILPHGITELSALLLASGMGSYLSLSLIKKILKKGHSLPVKETLKMVSLTFLYVILPLLVVSALIEAFITPGLITQFALKK